MQLEIPEAIANEIQAKAAAAGFESVEQYILDRLDLEGRIDPDASMSTEQWQKKFDAFLARQISRNPNFDDSRESIYPVR